MILIRYQVEDLSNLEKWHFAKHRQVEGYIRVHIRKSETRWQNLKIVENKGEWFLRKMEQWNGRKSTKKRDQ